MNTQEIHQLYDGLGKILELAEKNQKNSLDATGEMHNAIRHFEQTTQQLKGQIQKDLSSSINAITIQATSNFEKSAKKASEYYRNERRNFWIITIISIPTLLFLYKHIVRLTTPSLNDIVRIQHDLNQIKSEIENKKKELEKINSTVSENKINLGSCDERLCVQINPKSKSYGENNDFLILSGH